MQQAASFAEVAAVAHGEALPGAEELERLGREMQEQAYRNLAQLREAVAQLQLGGRDMGGLGTSLSAMLGQLEANICDQRSSNYRVTFAAEHGAALPNANEAMRPSDDQSEPLSGNRRSLLQASASGGASSAGRASAFLTSSAVPGERTTQGAARWGGYIIALGNRTSVDLRVRRPQPSPASFI